MSSGVVLNDEVRWITFHSGYDFGYLLKILTCLPLPPNESDFFEILGERQKEQNRKYAMLKGTG